MMHSVIDVRLCQIQAVQIVVSLQLIIFTGKLIYYFSHLTASYEMLVSVF